MSGPHPAPAAIAALATLTRAAADGVRVDDGPPVTDIQEPDAIGIGVDVVDIAAATCQNAYSLKSADQPFDLACVAQSWSGVGDLGAVRVRVFALLDVVAGVLAAHPDLGLDRMVWDARISSWGYRPMRGKKGVAAVIEFTVRINAYR